MDRTEAHGGSDAREVEAAMKTVNEILPEKTASQLSDYRRAVQRALPSVEKLILFGSRARGQATPDSDYDVALLSGIFRIAATSDASSPISPTTTFSAASSSDQSHCPTTISSRGTGA